MTDQPTPGEKKIIVDEDWKSRVDEERDAVRQEKPAEPADKPDVVQDESEMPVPEPNLSFLFGGMYLQGLVALGLLPNPATDQPEKNLSLARHTIDMLDMLREKTEGNRTLEETKEIDTILHELRLAFVTADS